MSTLKDVLDFGNSVIMPRALFGENPTPDLEMKFVVRFRSLGIFIRRKLKLSMKQAKKIPKPHLIKLPTEAEAEFQNLKKWWGEEKQKSEQNQEVWRPARPYSSQAKPTFL